MKDRWTDRSREQLLKEIREAHSTLDRLGELNRNAGSLRERTVSLIRQYSQDGKPLPTHQQLLHARFGSGPDQMPRPENVVRLELLEELRLVPINNSLISVAGGGEQATKDGMWIGIARFRDVIMRMIREEEKDRENS